MCAEFGAAPWAFDLFSQVCLKWRAGAGVFTRCKGAGFIRWVTDEAQNMCATDGARAHSHTAAEYLTAGHDSTL